MSKKLQPSTMTNSNSLIRSTQWDEAFANRWFTSNMKIYNALGSHKPQEIINTGSIVSGRLWFSCAWIYSQNEPRLLMSTGKSKAHHACQPNQQHSTSVMSLTWQIYQ